MIDDVPVAEPNTRTVPVGTLQTVDVQLIVDISGSMGDDVGDVPDPDPERPVRAVQQRRRQRALDECAEALDFIAECDRQAIIEWCLEGACF